MSAAVREALAAAANAYLGEKHVTPYYRQATAVGFGWVSLARRARDASGFGFMDTWEIRVVLSQDVAKAEKWIDTNADALADAIGEELVVTALAPGVLNIDSKTTINALIIEGVREH